MQKILITANPIQIEAEPLNTPTARAIFKRLPIHSKARTWGEEIYFSTPIDVPLEPDAKDVVEPGELAFWVEGHSIAIGFGRTPMSHDQEIRLATKTNIWAKALTDVKLLKAVKDGETISVELIDS